MLQGPLPFIWSSHCDIRTCYLNNPSIIIKFPLRYKIITSIFNGAFGKSITSIDFYTEG